MGRAQPVVRARPARHRAEVAAQLLAVLSVDFFRFSRWMLG
jgi:hypothetical protein